MVHHDEDAGLLSLDEAACEAVGNASARGPSAGIQVRICCALSMYGKLLSYPAPVTPF